MNEKAQQRCRGFSDDLDAPGLCAYCGDAREAHKSKTSQLASKHGFTLGHLHEAGGRELEYILERYDSLDAVHRKVSTASEELARSGNLNDESLQAVIDSPNFRDYEKLMARELLSRRSLSAQLRESIGIVRERDALKAELNAFKEEME